MKKIILTIAMTLSLLLVVGCSNSNSIKNNPLDEILSNNNYTIVDVRTKEEYDVSHVKGSINIPYDEIDENTNLDKTKTILVYCRTGKRSTKAFDTLTSLGYNAYNMGAFSDLKLEKE